MKYLLYLFIIVCIVINTNNFGEAYVPIAQLDHKYNKPLHGMLIENDPIKIDVTVSNRVETQKTYVVKLDLENTSSGQKMPPILLYFELKSLEERTINYYTNLIPGQWQLSLNLFENSTDCCHVQGYSTWIIVQTIQDLYTLLTAMGTILGASAATLAIIFQQLNNKRNLTELKKERETAMGEMSKQREISSQSLMLARRELETRLRPWVFPIKFGPTYVHLPTLGLHWTEYVQNVSKYPQQPLEVRIGITIKNQGSLAAKNFQFKILLNTQEISKERIEKENYHSNIRTLFPGEEVDADLDVPYKTWKIAETGKIWIAFMLKYDVDTNAVAEVGLLGYLEKGSARRRLTWDNEYKKTST
jgi:hypothetical protein